MTKTIPCLFVVEDDRAVRDLIVAFLRKWPRRAIQGYLMKPVSAAL
jgi:hypothetical protein